MAAARTEEAVEGLGGTAVCGKGGNETCEGDCGRQGSGCWKDVFGSYLEVRGGRLQVKEGSGRGLPVLTRPRASLGLVVEHFNPR